VTVPENNPERFSTSLCIALICLKSVENAKINELENLQSDNKERLFGFLVFQQLLKEMLKTSRAFSGKIRISTSGMWKTARYTPSIHSFNRIFNIFSRSFHSLHPAGKVTECFQLFKISAQSRRGK